MRFDDKAVAVTGAATGIGAAIVRGFAAEGARVYAADDDWGGASVPEGVERRDCDVSNDQDVHDWIASIEERHGAVDVLVNDAALSAAVPVKPFEQISADEWKRILVNNTIAPFLCTRAVAPRMRERKRGRIVNLCSGTAFIGVPNVLAYVSSKGAIATMTRALSKELGSDGINVNAVAPGLTMTEGMLANPGWTEQIRQGAIASRGLKREETADDLVGAVLFLASDDAAFITGQILVVDGGAVFH